MKRFLTIVIIMFGVHSLIAQIDREEIVSVVKEAIEESDSSKRKVKYVLPNYQERQQQNKEADAKSLEVAKSVVEEAGKVYDENMKSGMTNISHNVEPWWVSVNTNESQEEVNTYNSESSDIKSTEKLNLIEIWNISSI